ACGQVDQVEGRVHQLGTERGGKVAAAALHEQQLEGGEPLDQLVDGFQIDRRVLADRGVRAAAGLDADHPFSGQDAATDQELGVLLRIDIVGDHRHVVTDVKTARQGLDE